jgi:hypothetical protein
VYRVFGDGGELLYIGIAMNVFERMKGHRHEALWWPAALTGQVDRYSDRRTAKTVESRAIRSESPKHNVAADRAPYPDDAVLAEPIETLTLFWQGGRVWVNDGEEEG